MSSARNNFYLQFFQSVLLPAGWTAPPQHIGGGHIGRTPWLGLLFRAHFLTLCCYPQHNSAAAHPLNVVIQRIISSGRSRRDFHGRVVIPHTFCSFAPPCPVLLFSTHFIPENNTVVIGSTIQPCWISVFCDFLYCYSAHILQFVEFRQSCYPQHNS